MTRRRTRNSKRNPRNRKFGEFLLDTIGEALREKGFGKIECLFELMYSKEEYSKEKIEEKPGLLSRIGSFFNLK